MTDALINELWKKVKKTHRTALKEWVKCFKEDEAKGDETDEDAAKREIRETLINTETMKDRSKNFLLRLISDDENGYKHPHSEPRPRVQLALAFVEQMGTKFVPVLSETLSVHKREAGSTQHAQNVQEEDEDEVNANENVRLIKDRSATDGNEIEMMQKRGNELIHEVAKSGRCAILEKLRLLTAENVNYLNNVGETALHLAAEFEHPEDVKILLTAGAECKVSVML